MRLSLADVERVARLACLSLEAEQAEHLRREMTAILQHMAKLADSDIQVSSAPETVENERVEGSRPDQIQASLDTEAALANAPQRRGDWLVVPVVVDE